jgi:hypothetical protein
MSFRIFYGNVVYIFLVILVYFARFGMLYQQNLATWEHTYLSTSLNPYLDRFLIFETGTVLVKEPSAAKTDFSKKKWFAFCKSGKKLCSVLDNKSFGSIAVIEKKTNLVSLPSKNNLTQAVSMNSGVDRMRERESKRERERK